MSAWVCVYDEIWVELVFRGDVACCETSGRLERSGQGGSSPPCQHDPSLCQYRTWSSLRQTHNWDPRCALHANTSTSSGDSKVVQTTDVVHRPFAAVPVPGTSRNFFSHGWVSVWLHRAQRVATRWMSTRDNEEHGEGWGWPPLAQILPAVWTNLQTERIL